MDVHLLIKEKNTPKTTLILLILLILLLLITGCTSMSSIGSLPAEPEEKTTSPVSPTESASSLITPTQSTSTPGQDVTIVAPDILGEIQFRQYTYFLRHDFDFNACTTDFAACPDIYYALLADAYDWLYVQPGESSQLQFKLDGAYQIRFSETNQPCQVMQDSQNINLFVVTCQNAGEYVLKFEFENMQHGVSYPLHLNIVSAPEQTVKTPVIPHELSIEEYELTQHPESDTRFFEPVTGSASEILAKHELERGQPLQIVSLAYLANGQEIHAEVAPELTYEMSQSEELPQDFQGTIISITQEGHEIFTTKAPVLANASFLGLWTHENHWLIEVMRLANDSFRALTRGEIFQDGQSLNELNGYRESFGFQFMHGKPFYFFERDGRVGIVYDGQEIPLGYDRVLHYGCCSAGSLNPLQYENMVGFFAVRDGKWYYVELGVFE